MLFECNPAPRRAGSATADMGAPGHFSSGLLVLEPSEALHAELLRLIPLLSTPSQSHQTVLNRLFPEWRLRSELQLPEVFNFFLRWRGTNAWFSRAWAAGVSVLHFSDTVKPHNWFLLPTATAIGGAAPARLSFVGQQGEFFHRWSSVADAYECEVRLAAGGRLACNRSIMEMRESQCHAVTAHYAGECILSPSTIYPPVPAPAPFSALLYLLYPSPSPPSLCAAPAAVTTQFSVVISHAPFRHRLPILLKIEAGLQARRSAVLHLIPTSLSPHLDLTSISCRPHPTSTSPHPPPTSSSSHLTLLPPQPSPMQTVAEVHTIFLIVHGAAPSGLTQSGPKPLVEVHPAFDALGNRFGPLRVATDAVLIMDDDIVVDPRDISHAFRAWQQVLSKACKPPTSHPLSSPQLIAHSTPVVMWQAQGQLVGTFMRAVYRDGADSTRYKYTSLKADRVGMRRQNVVLTKFLFVHRHYLYMYACLLPYRIWEIPNRRINCEDVLMNFMVSVASGLPPMPFQPAYGVQLDYGTPPPASLLGTVATQTGLSNAKVCMQAISLHLPRHLPRHLPCHLPRTSMGLVCAGRVCRVGGRSQPVHQRAGGAL